MKSIILMSSLIVFNAWASKPQVVTQKLELTTLKQTLLYPALVKSRIESNIKADSDLIVIKSHVNLGQRVKRGDILLELKQQDTSLNYNNRLIKAPVDGVVANLSAAQGQYVTRGEDLLLINEPEKLFLRLELPVTHHKEVKVGLKVQINPTDSATITGVGSVMDSMLGTLTVEVELPGSLAPNYVTGSIQNVEIVLGEKQKLIVPEKALYFSGDKIFLPTLINGKVAKKEITGSSLSKGQLEILTGVQVGDEIIVGAGEFLKEGDEVEISKKM